MSINIEISYAITNILCLSLATLLLLRIKPEFSPENSWGDKPIWNLSLGPRGSRGVSEPLPWYLALCHLERRKTCRCRWWGGGAWGSTAGPGGAGAACPRSVGEDGGVGSQAEGGTDPACEGSGHSHPALLCVTRNTSSNPDAIYQNDMMSLWMWLTWVPRCL